MTDEELDSFESACKAARDGNYGYNSKLFLELIAMIRQARAERDWLVDYMIKKGICYFTKDAAKYCQLHDDCDDCTYLRRETWFKAAEEATCPKN